MKRLLFLFAAFCISCGDSARTAGTIIETNTGNKECARVFVSAAALELKAGDTVFVRQTESDSSGDTIFVTEYVYGKYADSLAVASGILSLDSVPVGTYDTAEVRSTGGEVRKVSVNWTSEENEVSFDPALGSEFKGTISLSLPEGFEDLATASETFADVPALFPVPSSVQNSCLLDPSGNLIRLDSHGQVSGEDSLYWGIIPQAEFSSAGTLDFDIIENCQASNDIALSLGRRSEHFGSGALSLDTASPIFLVADFEPFVEARSTGVSFWIRGDSASQAFPYARILSAKSDAGGFVIQRRGATGSVNIRIDTRDGSYNALFGRSAILDGSWHNYAFTLRGDSIFVYADGQKVQCGGFEQPGEFSDVFSPVFGSSDEPFIGTLDEAIFLSGEESENWMRLFYALQRSAVR